MPKREQYRNFSLVSYCTQEFLDQVLELHTDRIKAFAYCYHDEDKTDDGNIKPTHVHILLLLHNPLSPSTIKNWFYCIDGKGFEVNTLVQKLVDIPAMYRYLIHEDNPEKFQYLPEFRICSDSKYFSEIADNDDVAKLALFDLLDGVPLREVAHRYGRDFIYHYGHIKQIYLDILASETPQEW